MVRFSLGPSINKYKSSKTVGWGKSNVKLGIMLLNMLPKQPLHSIIATE